jgi:hypothetical protein
MIAFLVFINSLISPNGSEWVIVDQLQFRDVQLYHGENRLIFHYDEEIRFVLDNHAELDVYSASSLKQQSEDMHVAPLGHIIMIPSQPVFAFST